MTNLLLTYLRRHRQAEEGSILILVLAIVIGVVLSLAAILSFAQSGLNTSVGYRFYRNTNYYTDGVMDGAINALRGSTSAGSVNNPLGCVFPDPTKNPPVSTTFSPGTTGLSSSDQGAGSHNYSVTCQAMSDSGTPPTNQPQYAILTLGPHSSGDGLSINGNHTLLVDGSVYVNGDLSYDTSNNTGMLINGDITAAGSCPTLKGAQVLTVRGIKTCGSSTATDPGYSAQVNLSNPVLTDFTTVDPTPTCASSSSVISFAPGFYTEVPTAPAGCNGNTWWFTPGLYYFDFQPAPSSGNSWSGTWSPPPNVDIVGGTPTTWGASTSASTVGNLIGNPSACSLPSSSSPTGVQWIFGGPSTLTLAPTNKLELCSYYFGSAQQIALYALKSGTRTEIPSGTLSPSTFSTTGTFALAPGSHLPATAVLAASTSGSVTSNGFGTVPSGSEIKSVKLNITHQETSSNVGLSGSISFGGNGPFALPTGGGSGKLNDCTTSCTQTIDVTGDLPNDFPYKYLDGTNPVSVVYSASEPSKKGPDTDTLSTVTLTVDYIPPGFEKTCSASSCNLLFNNPQGSSQNMFFHGTVYAPTSSLSVTVQNGGTTIFDRGVIAETVTVDVSASSKQLSSPFSLPKATVGRHVLFTASVDGVAKLRAVALYQDFAPDPGAAAGTIAIPGYAVTITNWSVLRQ